MFVYFALDEAGAAQTLNLATPLRSAVLWKGQSSLCTFQMARGDLLDIEKEGDGC